MERERRFFLDDALGEISVIDSWDYPKYNGREELIPFIIPPSLGKSFGHGEIMGIWADIYRALQRADNICIFGYSLPSVDLHSKFTIPAAVQNNRRHQKAGPDGMVTIFNPDPAVRQTFSDILGSRFIFKQVSFGDVDFTSEITTCE